MPHINDIKALAQQLTAEKNLFIVEFKDPGDQQFELIIDSDTSVSIDDCIAISRAINAQFDREVEDYSLTVSSAGVGQPLKVLRQYLKLVGKPVEVLLKDGMKYVAQLKEATEESITIGYTELQPVEGKKRKQPVEIVRTIPLDQVKSTREHLDFK